MSNYKMNQYDLQSYFKSVCNSYYIAYDKLKRLEKEKERLENEHNEEALKTVKTLLGVASFVTLPNKYVTSKYSREELKKEEKRLEAKKREYEKLENIITYWADKMWEEYKTIKSILYEINRNKFSIIITTKAEVYALMRFYWEHHSVREYPVVNMEEEHRQAFPTGEEVYKDFLYAYKADNDLGTDFMGRLYNRYF